ncbi:hypothetical protein RVV18_005186 [Burkholderia ambifaria]|nr:hypothetical protein [Burkholderia ambifaria]
MDFMSFSLGNSNSIVRAPKISRGNKLLRHMTAVGNVKAFAGATLTVRIA